MQIFKYKYFLSVLFLSSVLHSQETDLSFVSDDPNLSHWQHPSGICHCHDEVTHVTLKYNAPEDSDSDSKYGIYVNLLTINSEIVTTDKELFKVLKGYKRNACFNVCMKPGQTLVAFAVSFDHDFQSFSSENVGTLKAIVNHQKIPISFTEYESNIGVGYFNLE